MIWAECMPGCQIIFASSLIPRPPLVSEPDPEGLASRLGLPSVNWTVGKPGNEAKL